MVKTYLTLATNMLALALLFLVSCKTYTPNNLPQPQLIYGSGGGITGEKQTYILLKNGQQFFTSSLQKDTVEVNSISRNSAKQLFKQLEKVDIEKNACNEPGNMYYFIGQKVNNKTSRAVWGKVGFTVSSDIINLYTNIISQQLNHKKNENK